MTPDIPRNLSPEARLVTPIPGPESRKLAERRNRAVPIALRSVSTVFVDFAGNGQNTGLLTDVDGNTIIDMGAGIAVNSVGSADPEVSSAISGQAERFTHSAFPISPYEGYVALAETLNDAVPGEDNVTALFNSGAEAVENGVKIARRATRRPGIVVVDTGFHGRTNLTMAMTARNTPYKDGLGPFAPEVYRAPMSYPLRDPDGMTGEEAAQRTAEYLQRHVGGENIAAIVIEPISGEGGFVVPAEGYLPGLARWSADNGVLFVADEVQTGFGRTGDWFASEHESLTPDMMTLGKAMGGGLPISAVTGRRAIMDSVPAGGLGGTFGGNPVAAEAALAVIEIMRRDDLPARARDIQGVAEPLLRDIASDNSRIAEVRGRGAMLAMEFVDPRTGRPDAGLAKQVTAEAHEQGVILLSAGVDGNVVRLSPSLRMPEDVLQAGLHVVKNAIHTASRAA